MNFSNLSSSSFSLSLSLARYIYIYITLSLECTGFSHTVPAPGPHAKKLCYECEILSRQMSQPPRSRIQFEPRPPPTLWDYLIFPQQYVPHKSFSILSFTLHINHVITIIKITFNLYTVSKQRTNKPTQ